MRLSIPIHRLKRAAKQHARATSIPLHAALDGIASTQGYASWSLLAARHASAVPDPAQLYKSLHPGELILIAARPGQGKTRLALQLALAALDAGDSAHFFSLDYTPRDVAGQIRTLPEQATRHSTRLAVDCSDAICADYIMAGLATAPRGSFAAIDYLQLLDQKRTNPPLDEQVRALAGFARSSGLKLAFICQIDRSYDPANDVLPGLADIRLPNPLDLAQFNRAIFIQAGRVKTVHRLTA